MKKVDINIIGYVIYLLIYVITVSLYGFGNSISNYRYYSLFGLCLLSFFIIFLAKKQLKKIYVNKSLLLSIVVGIVFLIISYIKAHNVNMSLQLRTFVQISLFLLPTIYAFYISNFLSNDKIIQMMKITLVILIFAYFFDFQEPDHHLLQFLNLQNWLSIDYIHSNSFTESNHWSEAFLQLFFFFYYCLHSDKMNLKNEKNIKIYQNISFVFTIFSFKRLSILISIVVLLFGKYIINKKFKKNHFFIFTTIFTIATIFYTKFMMGDFADYDTVFDLTSGRNYILGLWKLQNYLSYGYGTSLLVIGRYLEMDLVQIYMELNLFSLFIFILYCFYICKKNVYVNIIMLYFFLNMLTASTLPQQIGFLIMMTSISFTLKNDKNIENKKINYDIDVKDI